MDLPTSSLQCLSPCKNQHSQRLRSLFLMAQHLRVEDRSSWKNTPLYKNHLELPNSDLSSSLLAMFAILRELIFYSSRTIILTRFNVSTKESFFVPLELHSLFVRTIDTWCIKDTPRKIENEISTFFKCPAWSILIPEWILCIISLK